MADLTPEERQRIYLDEKVRLEVRQELEGKKTSAGKVIGYTFLSIIGLFVVLLIIGSAMQQSDTDAFNRLTPAQRHAKTLENCASLLKSYEYKTYSELSVTDRQVQAACTEQLSHPDQEIIHQGR
jgi:hypothetical protein